MATPEELMASPRSSGPLPLAVEAAGRSPSPHPPELRRRAVELAREVDENGDHRCPIAQLARYLKKSVSCLRNWLAADAIEAANDPG